MCGGLKILWFQAWTLELTSVLCAVVKLLDLTVGREDLCEICSNLVEGSRHRREVAKYHPPPNSKMCNKFPVNPSAQKRGL